MLFVDPEFTIAEFKHCSFAQVLLGL